MDAQKILDVLDIYARRFIKIQNNIGQAVSPIRQDPSKKYFDTSEEQWQKLSHVWWAIGRCSEFVSENRLEKAFRWLGFIQGALWHAGIYSVEELANHNRPTDEPTDLSPDRRSSKP